VRSEIARMGVVASDDRDYGQDGKPEQEAGRDVEDA
jgi:hypothetical protein